MRMSFKKCPTSKAAAGNNGRRYVPSFELAREKLANIGLRAEDILYVGNDMLNDVWAANRCGFLTALFAGDQRSLRLREDDDQIRGIKPDQ